jgi:hypothetical protein
MGRQEPSERIAPKYKETDGPDAEKILRIGGIILDPWQAEVLDDWLAMTPGRKWMCKTCGGSVPRQNGKTGLVQGRANTGMLLYNEQVIYTAHLQKTATETFEEMAAFFDSSKLRKHVKDIKTALGREQIILQNGARVKFLARTRNGGRGQHGDLLIFDEAQELDEDAQASFLPAISASLNPQAIYVGTPPDSISSGYVFRNLRKRILNGDTKQASWFEFSVKDMNDIANKERWAETNPALGRRILLSTIEGEFEQMSPDKFARERLGWWAPVVEHKEDYAIPEAVWMACASAEPKPEGKTAFGIKFSADGSEVALAGAVIPAEGPARISLIEYRSTGEGTKWLADWLNARYEKASCVVIDGKNGVDVLVDKISDTWRYKGSVMRPGVKEVIASVSLLVDSLNEKTITWFQDQEPLKESATTATKRPIAGGWGFGGNNSAPIAACALALYGAKTSKRNPGRKMLIG